MTLDEIALTTNTDKSSAFHDYCRTYDELFSPIRHEAIRLLEMGVLGGDSIVMWCGYFDHPGAKIMGIDIETHRCQTIGDRRATVKQFSQCDPDFWNQMEDGSIDIMIDDASHFASQQMACFPMARPKLKSGGFYCIEDLHTYASQQHCDAQENVMQWLARIATEMQGRGPDASGRVEPTDLWVSIDTIAFRKGLCVIRKMP